MKTPHTPGPWVKEGATVCQAETLQTICKTLGKNEEIQSANARLIAAAPDLLDALNLLLNKLHAHAPGLVANKHMENAIVKAEMVIAKAKGEA